ncbi:hypothetical protein T07_3993 [Trichinella nelsoni]|uniref:Uncharacterized protein n=1 Tax=Trichinella nelsoni TaxID=6336 RepID=A0A0V0S4X3_9BILA|nr:hypothetical protein T07_3993 [Trichinella nelsoni]
MLGSTEIRTRIAGFKVQSASRYTMEPLDIMASCLLKFLFIITYIYKKLMVVKREVPPRFELGLLDSESRVLAVTPWDLL